jgi:hypothetical protein
MYPIRRRTSSGEVAGSRPKATIDPLSGFRKPSSVLRSGGLARAVGAEEAGRSGWKLSRDPGEGDQGTVGDGKVAELDQGSARHCW